MNDKLVSVILPVFNGQRWLRAALQSVCQQIGASIEVIVIDDGSNDRSPEIAEEMARTYPIRLLRNDRNLGIVASLNRGLDIARTRFIARMDADDICMPRRIARQVEFLQAGNADLCGSWFQEFGQGLPRVVRWPHSVAAVRAAMLFQNTLCHPTIVAKREVFDRFRYREEFLLAEDYDLFARAISEFKVGNVPEVLLRYRRHATQATQARRDAMEAATRRIRIEALNAVGIETSDEERKLHNLIRAPRSILGLDDLNAIEKWLIKLLEWHHQPEAKSVVATQWTRACIRAAPLGLAMFKAYRASPLLAYAKPGLTTLADLAVLATARIDYASKPFSALRRLGLSA